jgi:ferric-dicitrate binding protein FerR (iron transport regulator)
MRIPAIRTVALIAGVLALAGQPAVAQTSVVGPGRVVSITGSLSVRHSKVAARVVGLNEAVAIGDELVTDAQSEATIQTPDGSTVHVYPDSRVIFTEPSLGMTDFLHLIFGSIKVHIEKLSGRPNPHSMTTPTAVIAVRGTTFSVFVDDTDATLVAVDEGLVAVSNRAERANEVLLRPGQRTWVRGTQPPLRAQAFRGRSEQADMAAGAMSGMAGHGMGSATMAGAMGSAMGSGRVAGVAGMSGKAGPPH